MADATIERVDAAVRSLRTFMDENLAASKIELEAKLIESYYDTPPPPPFEPAHLHRARNILESTEEIVIEHSATRGGSTPPIFVTTNTHRRAKRVDEATARKRLLMSRFYSYVAGGDAGAGLAGRAGELAFHAALGRARIGAGLAVMYKGLPQVASIGGRPVPIGPLDNAFVLQPLDKATKAPIGPFGVTALVEVKNIREWVYPRTQELYQVLLKAALIQAADPDGLYLPVLVCRRSHITTRFMAADLGFFVIDAKRQYLPAESSLIKPDALLEVTMELGLTDLVQGTDSTREIENRLTTMQQYFNVKGSIDTWREFALDPDFRSLLETLFDQHLPNPTRDDTLNELREYARQNGATRGW